MTKTAAYRSPLTDTLLDLLDFVEETGIILVSRTAGAVSSCPDSIVADLALLDNLKQWISRFARCPSEIERHKHRASKRDNRLPEIRCDLRISKAAELILDSYPTCT